MSRLTKKDRLEGSALAEQLESVPAWTLDDQESSISRSIAFSDFKQAFRFMTDVAGYAERINHHPEWCNVWNRVDIKLTTHTAGGLTENDFCFAQYVDRTLADFSFQCVLTDEGCGGCR